MSVSRRQLLSTAGLTALGTTTLDHAFAPAAVAASDLAKATTPQQFGAVANGVADDTDAIQAAIDAQATQKNKIVYFPPGTYRITRTLVVPDHEAVSGDDFSRLVLAGAGTMGSRTSIIDVDFDGTGIEVRAALVAIRGLCFVVAAGLKNTIAVHTARDAGLGDLANTDDVDPTITECTFVEFYRAVKHVGRGLVFTNNLVATGDFGLDISWPTEGVAGSGVHLLPYGMRKWLIEGNHFHSTGTAIVTTGADAASFRGAVIANNLMDIGRRLFAGGIVNSTFSGNVVENASGGPIVNVTSGGSNLTFTGNVFGGGEPGGGNRPPYSIAFGTEVQAHNVTISGNSFNWLTRSPVYFAAAASRITIASNSFDNWNLDADERWAAIRINGDASDISIIGNLLGANPVTDAPPVRIIGALTRSTILGNTFENTAGVVWARAITGDNVIERRSAGAPRHEFTAAADAALVVRATATDAHEEAYGGFLAASDQSAGAGPGVKGGVRVVPTGGSGAAAVEVLVATVDANEVAAMRVAADGVLPTADNARDLGSPELRMRSMYAHDVQLAPRGSLPAPTPGALAVVQDGSGTPVLAFSDGSGWRRVVVSNPL